MVRYEDCKYKLSGAHCVVIGDVMLDEYIFGMVESICPEAPVPIVKSPSKKHELGGAANVCKNICCLGANVVLVGVIGDDRAGGKLLSELKANKIEWRGVKTINRKTTTKTRILGNSRQLVRLDYEDIDDISDCFEDSIISALRECIPSADVIVISDYKKGVCTYRLCRSIIQIANVYQKKVIVDTKESDLEQYRGAWVITPNRKEFSIISQAACINCKDLSNAALNLINKYEISNILITKAEEGMTLVNLAESRSYKATAADVCDVTGAGDTVVATVAAFVSIGVALSETVEIANISAGIAVGKIGAYATNLEEIMFAHNTLIHNKVLSLLELDSIVNQKKSQGKKVVFTNGCFDLLHYGHVSLLKKAKELGDILIVGINSDDSIKRLKGVMRPINNEQERVSVIAALEAVDYIVIFKSDTPIEVIRTILPSIIVKGADYAQEDVVGGEIVIANGGKIVTIPLIEDISTTKIINRYLSVSPAVTQQTDSVTGFA